MESPRNSSVAIDIDKFYNFLKIGQNQHCESSSNQSSVCEIHQLIRKIHDSAYDPSVVSIGPYHHGKESLKFMEKKKWSCLQCVLKANPRKHLDDYMKLLRELSPLARSYYSEEIISDNDHFLRILLLDSCFIFVVLSAIEFESNFDDQYLILEEDSGDDETVPWEYNFVKNDLFLVENQIPFFLLKRLYQLITNEENSAELLADKISNYVEQMLCNYPIAIKESERPRNFDNLLHSLQLYLRPTQNYEPHAAQMDCTGDLSVQSLQCWHRAIDYHVAEIQFEKREFDGNNPHSLLDVRLISNVLEIPHLQIDENMATNFRNLIAFEQKSPQLGNDITAYIMFLSHIVCTAEDSTLLVSEGIIQHQLRSDEEVSNIFRELSDVVDFDFSGSYYLKNICHNVEASYQSYMKSWRGWMKSKISAIRGWT